jgi:hypothetical protein
MAREELKWQNIDADDLPAQVKKSFDAMVEAEAAFKADLEKLLKAEGHMPEDKFLVMSRKGKRLGVAFVSTPRGEGGARRSDVGRCLSPDGYAAWTHRQNAVRNPSPHVAAFNWVQAGQSGCGYSVAATLSRPQEHPAHRQIQRAFAGSVSRFLERLSGGRAGGWLGPTWPRAKDGMIHQAVSGPSRASLFHPRIGRTSYFLPNS